MSYAEQQYTIDELTPVVKSTGWKLPPVTNMRAKIRKGIAYISWIDPEDVEVNGATAVEWAGTLVVRKENSAPTSITDGTVIVDSKVRNQYSEDALVDKKISEDKTYFYGIFPYTTLDKYTLSSAIEAKSHTVYAMHIQGGESNTEAIVTYPEGYDNSNFTKPMSVNLTTGVPDYGDWKDAWFFPRSCMLKYDGTVDYYLNEDDETKKEDGTPSDVANMSYGGNAMMEWGQDGNILYWKCVPDANGNGETFVIANDKIDEDMQPWNHINCKGEVATHFYTPKYFGSSGSSKLRSISGGSNYVSQAGTTELSMAKANNTGSDEIWNTEVFADWQLINFLLIMMSKSTNLQAKYGYGRCASGNQNAIGQGTMNGKGMFYGVSNQTSGVKIFGMENWWGNIWRRIAGYVNDRGTVKVKMCYGTQDGSTVDKYNTDGSGYVTQGTVGGSSGGYISAMNYSKHGMTPKTVSGSDNTYFPDGCWFNNSQTDYALVGGRWANGLHVGGLCSGLDYAVSVSGSHIGAALSCKPLT